MRRHQYNEPRPSLSNDAVAPPMGDALGRRPRTNMVMIGTIMVIIELGLEFKKVRDTFPLKGEQEAAAFPRSANRTGWREWIKESTGWSVRHRRRMWRYYFHIPSSWGAIRDTSPTARHSMPITSHASPAVAERGNSISTSPTRTGKVQGARCCSTGPRVRQRPSSRFIALSRFLVSGRPESKRAANSQCPVRGAISQSI